MSHDDHERELFEAAFHPPADPEPYDLSRPFDAGKLLDGFTEEVHEHQVDPDSPLGRAMAAARAAWARPDYVPLDPDTWTVTISSLLSAGGTAVTRADDAPLARPPQTGRGEGLGCVKKQHPVLGRETWTDGRGTGSMTEPTARHPGVADELDRCPCVPM
jgi:hypothetical protein